MENIIKEITKLTQENIYEQTAARISIASGLINCYKLDEEAKKALELIGITPELYYKTREEITNRGDRLAAARYYSQFLNIQDYNMHHTADGLYIIPVENEKHKNTKHIGGSYMLNRRKINKLQQKLNEIQEYLPDFFVNIDI